MKFFSTFLFTYFLLYTPLFALESYNPLIRPEENPCSIIASSLSESEAKEVREIWRVIGTQEIVAWDGKTWLEMSREQKVKAISLARDAWREAGYKKIESVGCFIEDINRYYNQRDPQEGDKTKVGLVLSLSAFFSGIEK